MKRRMKIIISVLLVVAIISPTTSFAGIFSSIKSAIQTTAKKTTTAIAITAVNTTLKTVSSGSKNTTGQKDRISTGQNNGGSGVVPGTNTGSKSTGTSLGSISTGSNSVKTNSSATGSATTILNNLKGITTGALQVFSGQYKEASSTLKNVKAKTTKKTDTVIIGSHSVPKASPTGTSLFEPSGQETSIKLKNELKDKKGQKAGNTVTFDATAKGDHLTYQWYVKRAGDTEYKKWKGQTNGKLSYTLQKEDEGMQVYCVITDKNGNKKTTKASTVTYGSTKNTGRNTGRNTNLKSSLEVVYTGNKKICEKGETATLELQSKTEQVSQWRIKNEKGNWEKLGELQSKVIISFEEIVPRYPSWNGISLIPVEFSCVTNRGNHYEAIITFGEEVKDIGPAEQTDIISP